MRPSFSRRDFLKLGSAAAAGALLSSVGCSGSPAAPAPMRALPPTPAAGDIYLAVGRGPDPAAVTRAALESLGGMDRYVKADADVVIKPNICVDYHTPEYAATTNPIVVATLVTLCLEAGAKRVRVMDNPFGGTAESAYAISGIRDAVSAAGGEMEVMSPVKFLSYPIPNGKDLSEWKVYADAMEADVLIDVPIAKHHSLARLTAGGKNLLGLAHDPAALHQNLGQRIADLTSLLRPTLTVVDAVRILVDHGPTGGSLNDVKQLDTVIASTDIVAADAYAATLFGLEGSEVAFIKASADLGLGTLDLSTIKIEEVNV